MREVRIFEMEHDEPAAAWRVARPSTFKAISGEIWLTVEGDSEDHWLATGRVDRTAAPGRWVWISAGWPARASGSAGGRTGSKADVGARRS